MHSRKRRGWHTWWFSSSKKCKVKIQGLMKTWAPGVVRPPSRRHEREQQAHCTGEEKAATNDNTGNSRRWWGQAQDSASSSSLLVLLCLRLSAEAVGVSWSWLSSSSSTMAGMISSALRRWASCAGSSSTVERAGQTAVPWRAERGGGVGESLNFFFGGG